MSNDTWVPEGQPPKKLTVPPFADELYGSLPRFGPADGFNHRVKVGVRVAVVNFRNQFPAVTDVNDLSRTQSLRGFQP